MRCSSLSEVERWGGAARDHSEVSKPRETILLTFTRLCAAVVASSGSPPLALLLLTAPAILVGGGTEPLAHIERPKWISP
jgi:heme O synthase-like polyprenyltransferase